MDQEIIINMIPTTQGTIGHLILNRPQALNALSINMLEILAKTLGQWRDDDNICAVLIEGSGERAFCAGGDIRAVYHNRAQVLSGEQPYFEIEYHLNELIFDFPKPYIAILDGIAMGGGLGISVWGSHPIATERLVFAMPETGIGLFPDIGASYFLTRLPDHIGYYLGLTGNTLNAYEALHLGLVKTVISHESIPSFKKQINPQHIVLPKPIQLDTTSPLLDHRAVINKCFSQKSISAIIDTLENHDSWCQRIAHTLKSRSPLSLKVTFDYLNRSRDKNFKEVMAMNAKLVANFLRHEEFYEGIRAAVIDKDRNPRWQHPISEVDTLTVETFFE